MTKPLYILLLITSTIFINSFGNNGDSLRVNLIGCVRPNTTIYIVTNDSIYFFKTASGKPYECAYARMFNIAIDSSISVDDTLNIKIYAKHKGKKSYLVLDTIKFSDEKMLSLYFYHSEKKKVGCDIIWSNSPPKEGNIIRKEFWDENPLKKYRMKTVKSMN